MISSFLISILLAVCVTAGAYSSDFIQSINLKGRDFYFQLRHAFFQNTNGTAEILLVTLDDETLKRLEKPWPFSKSIYSEAIDRLKPYSPKAIGFDIIFSSEGLSAEGEPIVLASHLSSAGEIGAEAHVSGEARQAGIVDKPRDRDRRVRRFSLFFSKLGVIFPSWEAVLFKQAFGKPFEPDRPLLPTEVIDYRLREEEFSHVSLWRLLEGSVLAKELQNKIVLIGPSAEAFHDIHATPLGLMSGVAINANVLSMLIRGTFFSTPPVWFMPLLTFFSLWWTVLIGWRKNVKQGSTALMFLILIYMTFGFAMFLAFVLIDFWFLSLTLACLFMLIHLIRGAQSLAEKFHLRRESAPDLLTGFYTEQFLFLKLKSVIAGMTKKPRNDSGDLPVLVIQVNGPISDAAQLLKKSVRKNELICRLGQDRLAILLPNTGQEEAQRFSEKIKTILPAAVVTTVSGRVILNEVKNLRSGILR